jgi:hypothetical protein
VRRTTTQSLDQDPFAKARAEQTDGPSDEAG